MAIAQTLDECIPAVTDISRQMLFSGRDICPAATQLSEDLAFHNSINLDTPITAKEFNDLQIMSEQSDYDSE